MPDLGPPMPELPDLVHVEEVLNGALAGKTITDARTGDPTVLRLMVRDPFPAVLVGRRLKGSPGAGIFCGSIWVPTW